MVFPPHFTLFCGGNTLNCGGPTTLCGVSTIFHSILCWKHVVLWWTHHILCYLVLEYSKNITEKRKRRMHNCDNRMKKYVYTMLFIMGNPIYPNKKQVFHVEKVQKQNAKW